MCRFICTSAASATSANYHNCNDSIADYHDDSIADYDDDSISDYDDDSSGDNTATGRPCHRRRAGLQLKQVEEAT